MKMDRVNVIQHLKLNVTREFEYKLLLVDKKEEKGRTRMTQNMQEKRQKTSKVRHKAGHVVLGRCLKKD